VKFCMCVGLLSGQVFSPFGEHWLAGSHGGGDITSGMSHIAAPSHGSLRLWHSELGAATLLKAVWWDLHLVSLLTHLLPAALHEAQGADFEVCRPAGATRCINGGEIWHGSSSTLNFTPIGATVRV